MPKVTVVVPVYNSIKFIRECIDSLLNQTLKDIEVIVVDAGSNDGTLGVLEDYEKLDARVKLIHSKKKSMGHQYNLGIDAASGEYIGFLESDDYVASTMYHDLAEILDNHAVDYVKSDFQQFCDLNERLFLDHSVLTGSLAKLYNSEILAQENPMIINVDVNMWNALYRADFLRRNNVHLNETPKAAFQDIGFVMQTFCSAEKIMYVKIDSYKYRRDNLESSTYKPETINFIMWEFSYVINKLKHYSRITPTCKALIFKRFFGLFCGFYNNLSDLSSLDEHTKKELKEFQSKMRFLLFDIPYSIRQMYRLHDSVDIDMFFEDFMMFDKYRRKIYQKRKDVLKEFGNELLKYKNIIIFGASRVGKICALLLLRNKYDGNIIFCDNDTKKWGRFIDMKVLPPNEALDIYNVNSDVGFVVASYNYKEDIYNQLIDGAVDANDVILMIPCSTWSAFTISWGDDCDE